MTNKFKCIWEEGRENAWNTQCEQIFILNCDTPKENDMLYCCFCGREIEEQ